MIVKRITQGLGELVQRGNYVKVHYTGKLPCGSIFDCTSLRGAPLEFKVGVGHMIRGIDEAIAQLRVGDKAEVICPPQKAYGSDGYKSVPANSTVHVQIEVLSCSKF